MSTRVLKSAEDCCLNVNFIVHPAWSRLWHTDEVELWKGVRDLVFESHNEVAEVVDQWLLTAAVSRKQYLSCVVNRDLVIDGLFIWLAARWRGVHLNIMHTTGIWTTR